jgi:8-oxo-dGTP pyrophosphatase MutT (NUDIX family)
LKAIKKRSYGVVPYSSDENGELRFLILRAYKNWDFPKGGSDVGEMPLQAATRELAEETGIHDYSMPFGEASMDTEIYADGKVATYFLACVSHQDIVLPISDELGRPEHDESRWVSAEEAKSLLPARLKLVLEWALEYLYPRAVAIG